MAFRSTYSPNFDSLVRLGNQGIALGNNSLACWVRFDNLTASYEVIEINDSGGQPFASAIILNGNQIEYTQRNAAGAAIDFVGPTTVAANTWYHVALTYDGTTLRGYLNGAANGTATGLTGARGNWADLQVGPTLGYLSDALFYSAALSAAEIQQLMTQRLPMRRTNLEIWLPTFPGSNRLVDYSGKGRDFANNGTPVDATTYPAVGWGAPRPRIFLPPPGVALAATGSTQVSGTATMTRAQAITASGLTQVSGSASAPPSLTAAGSTQTTGTATVGKVIAITAAGATQCSGAVSTPQNIAITADGLTRTFGNADVSGSYPPGAPSTFTHQWRRDRRGR